jgi:hypothetical protein
MNNYKKKEKKKKKKKKKEKRKRESFSFVGEHLNVINGDYEYILYYY